MESESTFTLHFDLLTCRAAAAASAVGVDVDCYSIRSHSI